MRHQPYFLSFKELARVLESQLKIDLGFNSTPKEKYNTDFLIDNL